MFITNASFIYLQYFDIDENWFVVFFGINILTMMVFTLGTARLIHRIAPYQIWRAGRLLQFMAIVLLAVSVSLFELPLWAFAALLAIAIGAGGMINPSVTGLYLAHFDRLSGSAVSLMNVVVFLFGSVLGGRGNPDGIHWNFEAHQAVAELMVKGLAEAGVHVADSRG